MLMFYLSLLETQAERDQFTVLYQEYRDRLVASAMRILHDYGLAEDAVHDVFLTVINDFQIMPADDLKQMRKILFRSVHNQSINIRKKRQFEQSSDLLQAQHDFMHQVALDDIIVLRESVDLILESLRTMNENFRIPLEFYYLHHSTPREIAEIMGLSQAAVYKRLTRGHKELLHAVRQPSIRELMDAMQEEVLDDGSR